MMKKRRTFSFSSLILSRISWCLVVIFSVWGVWFYWAIINEINDETDDALEDYSETLIVRSLSGEALPTRSDASNNQFYLRPLPYRDIPLEERIRYKDSMVYIPKKREHEPARILTTVFVDGHGNLQELTVLTPTIEKKDLREAILFWIVVLYVLLLLAVLSVNIWVLNRGMRPLRVLLRWLDEYRIGGRHNKPFLRPPLRKVFRPDSSINCTEQIKPLSSVNGTTKRRPWPRRVCPSLSSCLIAACAMSACALSNAMHLRPLRDCGKRFLTRYLCPAIGASAPSQI